MTCDQDETPLTPLERDPIMMKRIRRVPEVVAAFVWRELVEELSDSLPCGFDCSFRGLAEQGLELGEELLDGVEVGRIRRQEEKLGARGADGAPDGLALV